MDKVTDGSAVSSGALLIVSYRAWTSVISNKPRFSVKQLSKWLQERNMVPGAIVVGHSLVRNTAQSHVLNVPVVTTANRATEHILSENDNVLTSWSVSVGDGCLIRVTGAGVSRANGVYTCIADRHNLDDSRCTNSFHHFRGTGQNNNMLRISVIKSKWRVYDTTTGRSLYTAAVIRHTATGCVLPPSHNQAWTLTKHGRMGPPYVFDVPAPPSQPEIGSIVYRTQFMMSHASEWFPTGAGKDQLVSKEVFTLHHGQPVVDAARRSFCSVSCSGGELSMFMSWVVGSITEAGLDVATHHNSSLSIVQSNGASVLVGAESMVDAASSLFHVCNGTCNEGEYKAMYGQLIDQHSHSTTFRSAGLVSATDKVTTHRYDLHHSLFLHQLRAKAGLRLLEIGYDKGASSGLWREYFPLADRVVFVDIAAPNHCQRKACPTDVSTHWLYRGDQQNLKVCSVLVLVVGVRLVDWLAWRTGSTTHY